MQSRFNFPFARPLGCAVLLGSLMTAEYSRAVDWQIDLPAQALSDSIGSLSQQAGVQVLYDASQLEGLKAPAVAGRYSMREVLEHLLKGSSLELVEAGDGFVVRRSGKVDKFSDNAMELDSQTIVGSGLSVDSSNVGRSTLTRKDIERIQADNIPTLLQTLPGVTMGGSPKPGGQTVNIWGLGDAEDVPFTLDGAPKSGFERYQQGTVFIEPELIKRIEVEKGPHSVYNGNGGFGGTVHMETKDAPDLLRDDQNVGAMLKYGYHSNDQQKIYSGAVYGRTEDRKVDALAYVTARDGRDIKLAGHIPDPNNNYPINPSRLPNSAQDLDAGLFKLNLHPNLDNDISLAYSRSHSTRWTPFSSASYPTPPTQSSIDRYGYEAALKRLLAHRDTTDTTWSGKYEYHPIDNPLIDLMVQYSESHIDQTDERNPDAFFQVSTGGRKMDTDYKDKVLELRNTSLFATGPVQHAFTVGTEFHRHTRTTDMYIPGSTYNTARYNYGHFQPTFMPSGKQNTNSAYIQDALTLGSVTITPSLRFDHVRNQGKDNDAPIYNNAAQGHDYSSQTYSGWSPRLSLFWTATERLGFFADYSRTWRAPVIDEMYEVQNSSTVSATSRDLDPERIHALRFGSLVNLPDLFINGDNLQVRTTLFQNKIKDEIFRTRSVGCEQQAIDNGTISGSCGDYLPLSNYRNLPGVTYKGFEIESFYDSPWLFGGLSYSWVTGKHDGAYSNPWGPNVWARDVPPAKWVATLGTKIPAWDAQIGWQGEFVRQTDRLPSDKYKGGMGTSVGDIFWDQTVNDSYDTQRVFASWKPRRLGFENTELNFTVDNLFNRDYHPALAGDSVYSQGRNAKFSLTQYF
ncbi:TonB-dependent receptor [Pseudomonas nitroreducens]|uniref:TonB-dependent receptor n=1 Tax=Pseudomonas nitroreducens TaxID=46680 RepID=UPI001875DD22